MDVAKARLQSQRLSGQPFQTAGDAVRWFGAVQAQDFGAAKWALGQRLDSATEAAVESWFDAGAFVRTHVLRPTWHFVAPEDVRWLQHLTAPRVKAQMAYYDRVLELDAAGLYQAYRVIESALRDGPRTRKELAGDLEHAGIAAAGQRGGHILMHAELDCLVVSGPRRGKQHTYRLLTEAAAEARDLPRDDALAELARRYFSSHGPAQIKDLAWWSSLTLMEAQRAVDLAGSCLQRWTVGDTTYFGAADQPPAVVSCPTAHLLASYDEFLVAYQDRSAALRVAPAMAPMEVFGNVVVVDGQVRGTWKLPPQSGRVELRFDGDSTQYETELHAAVSALGRYLGTELQLELKDPAARA